MRLLSRIKQMTREVVREGEDRRATFIAQGAPLRIYAWWHRHTKRQVTKENFCHYCRVVAIWAPLMFIRMMVTKLFSDRQFWLCMSLACAAIVIGVGIGYPGQVGIVLVGFLGFGVALVGFFAGIVFADYLVDKNGYDDTPQQWKVMNAVLMGVTAPIAAAGFALYQIIRVFRSKPARRFYHWIWNARLVKGHVSPLLGLILIGFCVMTCFSVFGGWWMVPVSLAALAVVIIAGRWGIEKFGFYLSRRRDERKANVAQVIRRRNIAALEPVLRVIFNHLHPASKDDEVVYWRWYRQYIVRAEQEASPSVWEKIYYYASYCYFPDWKRWDEVTRKAVNEELDRVRALHIQVQNLAEERRQKVVQKAITPFTVMADFIILLAQFIYAVKKKFCPYVKLPEES